ncbi:tumor necrosis factor [Rhineura floridana]|uniref:tumor necrosis factor n=1 Tax=Rhineura floridana TaxID=261503 RepID=UPI002AC7F44A|nr:tumor necrosis factor [Rhineura floridana]
MSSEHLVYDVEKGDHKIVVVREKPQKDSRWKCLTVCSLLLLIGATFVFAVLQFGAFKQSEHQDARENRNSFSEGLPDTMKVQALMSNKPAAHAIAVRTPNKQLVWTTDVAPAIQENGMQLDKNDNSLVVPSTGLYFVYSQVMFHGDTCPESPLLLSHTVSWSSSQFNSNVDLLKAIKSVCEGGSDTQGHKSMWFESIYQGAVFRLNKGDHVWSKTESSQYLDFTHHGQIYFGIVAM